MQVKICGITHIEDALAAVEYGADALGFVFAPESPRFIRADQVRKIVSALPPFVSTVAVFTAGDEKTIGEAVTACGIDLIQFHGPFSAEIIGSFSSRAIQVIRISDEPSLAKTAVHAVRAILLDTFHPALLGGSGVPFDWAIARSAKKHGNVILAGGLTPENVGEAIAQVQPYGVDVSSGVEMTKGRKDLKKLERFIQAAKRAGGRHAPSR